MVVKLPSEEPNTTAIIVARMVVWQTPIVTDVVVDDGACGHVELSIHTAATDDAIEFVPLQKITASADWTKTVVAANVAAKSETTAIEADVAAEAESARAVDAVRLIETLCSLNEAFPLLATKSDAHADSLAATTALRLLLSEAENVKSSTKTSALVSSDTATAGLSTKTAKAAPWLPVIEMARSVEFEHTNVPRRCVPETFCP